MTELFSTQSLNTLPIFRSFNLSIKILYKIMKLFIKKNPSIKLVYSFFFMSMLFAAIFLLVDLKIKYGVKYTESYKFTNYVSGLYLPEQRKHSGKWPTDLTNLPQFAKKDAAFSISRKVSNEVLAYFESDFVEMKVLKSNKKRLDYIIVTKQRRAICYSSVAPDDYSCHEEKGKQ